MINQGKPKAGALLVCATEQSRLSLETSLVDLGLGNLFYLDSVDTPTEIISRLGSDRAYRLLVFSAECADWLTPALQADLATGWNSVEVVVVGAQFITTTTHVRLPLVSATRDYPHRFRQSLEKALERLQLEVENQSLRAELENCEQELSAARQKVADLVSSGYEAHQQAHCRAVIDRLRHEVNNPLTGVLGQAQLLLRRSEILPEETCRRLETIEKLTLRISEVFRALEDTATYEPQPTDHHIDPLR